MNLDTVLKCAQIAANVRQASLGFVDDDIQALLAELTPAVEEPVVEEPVAEEAPVVEEEPAVEDTDAEEDAVE